ncbi:MAG: HD domain-containing protein [Acidimicrobiales bacterium]
MAKTPTVTILTSKYDKALTMVRTLQNGGARKGGGTVPYLAHSIGVSALVLEYGGTENQAIAALLHDVAEDSGGERMLDVITAEFNKKVAGYVKDLSDSLVEDSEKKEPWYPRKNSYIVSYKKKSTDVLLISAADKLHNVRAMLNDHKTVGRELWGRFDRKVEAPLEYKRTQQLWYQTKLSKVITDKLDAVQPYGAQLARDLQDELNLLKQSIEIKEGVSIDQLNAQIELFTGQPST